jgi:hypothetical protein
MKNKLNLENYISGLAQADGSFMIIIEPNKQRETGYLLRSCFMITQATSCQQILEKIKNFFSCGYFTIDDRKRSENQVSITNYKVTGVKSCLKIIAHFDAYPLLGEKLQNYTKWKKIVIDLQNKRHLDPENHYASFAEMIALCHSMNSEGSLRKHTHDQINDLILQNINNSYAKHSAAVSVCPKTNPLISSEKKKKYQDQAKTIWGVTQKYENLDSSTRADTKTLNSSYITGLIDGDGTFVVFYKINPITKILSVSFSFRLAMNNIKNNFEDILKNLQLHWNSGFISKEKNTSMITLTVSKHSDLKEHIIPHFLKYPLQTKKAIHFEIFKKLFEFNNEYQKIVCPKLKKEMALEMIHLGYNMNKEGFYRKIRKNDFIKLLD